MTTGTTARYDGLADWYDARYVASGPHPRVLREATYWGDGIRRHVGMHHVPLAGYLNAFITPGQILDRFEEPGPAGVPYSLAVRARRSD